MTSSGVPEANLKLIRPLIKRGEEYLKSNIRRSLGLYDNRIQNWLDECEYMLQLFQSDSQDIREKIEIARRRLDSQAIREIIDSLYRILSVAPITTTNNQSDFAALTQLPIPNLNQIQVESRLCFVIMPFSYRYKDTFAKAIKPSLEDTKCTPLRADKVYEPGAITTQIFYYLAKSEFCIADISSLNPNVLYELGIAHTLMKPTITITSDDSEKVPFDIASYRYITYRQTQAGLKDLYANLVKAITSITR